MKKVLNKIFAAFVVISLASCSVTGPVFITDNPSGDKVGKSSYRMIGNIILDGGDGSIKTAAENGGITKISTVDQKVEAGFLVVKMVTIVTGE